VKVGLFKTRTSKLVSIGEGTSAGNEVFCRVDELPRLIKDLSSMHRRLTRKPVSKKRSVKK